MDDTLTVPETAKHWGALATPVHADAAADGDPVWKDNGFIAFWDPAQEVFGSVHVSTSPNAPGAARRARCSMLLGGKRGAFAEVIEELEPGAFDSSSISFGLDGTITVEHPEITARIVNAPLYVAADYSTGDLIPPLVPGRPLQHFQQGCTVRGTVTVDDRTVEIDGYGMRDRTWGFRDESAQWTEYIGVVGVWDGTFITSMKFMDPAGGTKTEGFVIEADATRKVTEMRIRRTAAALFVAATLTLDDGSTRTIAATARKAGFFVPMGAETDGPAFGAYDDFMALELDGVPGGGFCEQGILHRIC